MNCQGEAFWREYIDRDSKLRLSEGRAADEHLKECRACQAKVAMLNERMDLVGLAFADSDERSGTAWDRFERERITEDKSRSFSFNTSVAAVAVVAVVLVGGLASAPGQSFASDLLNLFRAEKLAAVRIDPEAFASFDPTEMGDIEIDEPDGQEVESLAEASALSGLDVRLPSEPGQGLRLEGIHASTAGEARLTLDRERLEAFLGTQDIEDLELPPLIDGSTITALIPPTVMVEYADDNGSGDVPPLLMGQAGAPEISGPIGVDFDALRDELLKLPFFSSELSEQLANISDWKRTLPIPYPAEDVAAEELTVKTSGDGLYFTADDGSRILIWTADDQVFGIVAPLDSRFSRAELLAFAREI